ncbi:hypothetical protein V1519DRAFT_447837 [Lipomyces tetrasporus]
MERVKRGVKIEIISMLRKAHLPQLTALFSAAVNIYNGSYFSRNVSQYNNTVSAAWRAKRHPASFLGCRPIRTRLPSHSTILQTTRTAFEGPALNDKALNTLNTLRQGDRPFSELTFHLEAGGHEWDDDVKKGYILAAVNESLRDKLISIEEKPTYEGHCLQIPFFAYS